MLSVLVFLFVFSLLQVVQLQYPGQADVEALVTSKEKAVRGMDVPSLLHI